MSTLSFREFMEYAERLYDDAENTGGGEHANPYIIGSILTSWMAIESFVNNRMIEFASVPKDMFTVHERGFLEEKQVRFATKGDKAGTFYVENKEEFRRLEDKIMFLIAKSGKNKKVDRGASFWQRFEKIKGKRNSLTHPRGNQEIKLTVKDAQEAIEVAKGVITFVSKGVWGKPVTW